MHTVRRVFALALSAYAVWIYATALHAIIERDSTSIIARSYGGHLQFLTILSLVASMFHQALSVVSILTGLRSVAFVQDWLLRVSAPLEAVVSVLYWPLKFYNNDLVKDRRFDVVINPSLDRKCHLYPAIFQVLSATVFTQRPWRSGFLGPLALFSSVAGAYWLWFEHTASVNGFYPYPLLKLLDTQQKAGLVFGSALVAVVTFKIIQGFQAFVR